MRRCNYRYDYILFSIHIIREKKSRVQKRPVFFFFIPVLRHLVTCFQQLIDKQQLAGLSSTCLSLTKLTTAQVIE